MGKLLFEIRAARVPRWTEKEGPRGGKKADDAPTAAHTRAGGRVGVGAVVVRLLIQNASRSSSPLRIRAGQRDERDEARNEVNITRGREK